MKAKILFATAVVAFVTMLSGVVIAVAVSRNAQAASAEELSRQARVTAELIEEDLDDIRFRPRGNVPAQIARARNALERSLNRARVLGDHDVVEAVLISRNRTVPISEPLVLIPLLPPSIDEGDVVSVMVGERRVQAAIERLEGDEVTLTVAIGRETDLFPVRGTTFVLLAALGVGAILTLLLGVWFSTSLSHRLSGISDAATRVGAGDLSARAPRGGSDEIAEVAASFNAMADELQALGERERQFLIAVSHDLRTPLTTISGYAEALDAGDIPPEDLPRVAGILNGQTRHLSRLVEDVMALARLETSEFTLRPENVDIRGLVRGTVDTFEERAAGEEIELSVTCQNVGSMLVDPDRLVQVLGNLLENAMRYTPQHGEIDVICSSDVPGVVSIVVANTGPGITAHDLDHVFERLYVADRYRAVRPAGSGLGLSIVSELVELMGGSVRCSSDQTRTRFTVEIAESRQSPDTATPPPG